MTNTSVERRGTDKEAAEAWEKAAFEQARRANALETALRQARAIIDAALVDQASPADDTEASVGAELPAGSAKDTG